MKQRPHRPYTDVGVIYYLRSHPCTPICDSDNREYNIDRSDLKEEIYGAKSTVL